MSNLNTLFFFIFIFTTLVSIKGLTKMVGALLQGQPLALVFSNRELIFLGLAFSYLITYIFNR